MKKILWIDDNEDLIDWSLPIFSKNGFYVLKAVNTSRALSILREERLDGVLLDVHLRGGENGMELLEEIRHLYPSLKVVIFTGYPEYSDHINSKEQGATAYLTKIRKSFPIDPQKQADFFAALHKLFPETPKNRKATDLNKKGNISEKQFWSRGFFFSLIIYRSFR